MTATTTPDPYPEHERQNRVLDESHTIWEFLDSTEYILAEYQEIEGYSEPQLFPVTKTMRQVLAEYFDIDLNKIENEKDAMIAALRTQTTEDR